MTLLLGGIPAFSGSTLKNDADVIYSLLGMTRGWYINFKRYIISDPPFKRMQSDIFIANDFHMSGDHLSFHPSPTNSISKLVLSAWVEELLFVKIVAETSSPSALALRPCSLCQKSRAQGSTLRRKTWLKKYLKSQPTKEGTTQLEACENAEENADHDESEGGEERLALQVRLDLGRPGIR